MKNQRKKYMQTSVKARSRP